MKIHLSFGLLAVAAVACGSSPKPADPAVTPPTSTCGDGQLDPGEACDHDPQCGRRSHCTPTCTCEPIATPLVDSSQILIDDAFRANRIDRAMSLLYRAYALYQDPRLPEEFDGVGAESEDLLLPMDIQEAWSTLSAAQQATLEPFVVRPSNAKSVFSVAYAAATAKVRRADATDCATAGPCAGWESDETAHFRVWSCGSALASARADVAADGEALWGPMTTFMGVPAPDNEDNADTAVPKVDVYIVTLNQARLRDGVCKTINQNAAGQAVQGPPNGVTGGEPSSSGYLLLTDSTASSPADRTHILEHELFHLQQFAHSTRAVGTWLAESTAAWSEQHFLTQDEAARRSVFARFPEHPRDSVGTGFLGRVDTRLDLHNTGFQVSESYEAFIWHFFAEQENSASVVAKLWGNIATGGYGASGYNAAVNSTMPFADKFAKFIVRNLNTDAVKDSHEPVYYDLETRLFPHPTESSKLEKKGELTAGGMMTGPVSIVSLAAQYLNLTVNDNVHEITFDFSQVTGGNNVDLELLTTKNVGGTGGWKLTHGKGKRKITLCRDTGDDPVTEAYVALGNHDWQGEQTATGSYTITGKAVCCPAGQTCWSGTATSDEVYDSPELTIRRHSSATVQWSLSDGDPSGSTYEAKGTATFSGTITSADGCVETLAPTTRDIVPGHNDGALIFFPGGQQYLVQGPEVEGGDVTYVVQCPTGDSTRTETLDPWLMAPDMYTVGQPGDVLAGTYQDPTRLPAPIVYTWHFEKQ